MLESQAPSRLGNFVHAPEAMAMRAMMGRFLTGVAVITTVGRDGQQHGMTMSSLQSISLDPPVLMVAMNHGTRTGAAVDSSGRFAVSILAVKQEAVARRFAVRGGERFLGGEFESSPGGIPVVEGALAQAECRLHSQVPVGDHVVYFGQVEHCRHRLGSALVFAAGHFGDFRDFGHEEVPWGF